MLLLARANVSSLQIGELSLLLPAAAPADVQPTNDQRPTTNAPTGRSVTNQYAGRRAVQIEPTEAPTTDANGYPTHSPRTNRNADHRAAHR